MGWQYSQARLWWLRRGGSWRVTWAVSLAVVALIVLTAGARATRLGQTDGDTQILTEEAKGVATLPLFGGGEAVLRSPLAVFYEPGAQRLVISADGLPGVLTSEADAGGVGVTSCGDMTLPPSVRALCLQPLGLERVGTYTGTVQLLPPAANPTEATEETPGGAVKLSIVVQRSLFTFVGLAFLGTLLSHLAAWVAAEYQQIRQLRAECAEFVRRRAPKAKRYPRFACPEEDGESNGLKLVGVGQQIDEGQLKELHQPAIVLWLRSFLGKRPDYDALNEALAEARATREEFDRLCLQVDALKKLAGEVSRLYGQIGGDGKPGLWGVLKDATTFEDQSVPYNEVAKRLKQGGALEALSRRWLRLAEHVKALRRWREALMTAPAAGRPVVVDTSFHLAMAQRKLGAIKHNADFGVLRPDLDIQAAWRTLEERRLELLEQQKRERPLEGATLLSPTWALGPELPAPALLPELERLWRKVSVAWARWSPRLNTATLVLLASLSFLATVLVGIQALYLDKPWGTPLDMLVLLLLGGGIHAGLTGVAGAVTGSKSEAAEA